MKRAQGLPLNAIVLAVIAIIVLVLVVIFATGGLSKLFGGITTVGGQTSDLGTAQVACQSACNSLKVGASEAMFKSSSYCTKRYTIDLNSNGKIETTVTTAGPKEIGIPCWNERRGISTNSLPSISVRCTIQTDAGQTLAEPNCPTFTAADYTSAG